MTWNDLKEENETIVKSISLANNEWSLIWAWTVGDFKETLALS